MINPNISLNELKNNLEILKDTYTDIIVSFSYFKKKDLIKYKRQIKKEIYSLDTDEWKKNLIWRFFNDEEELETTLQLLGGENK